MKDIQTPIRTLFYNIITGKGMRCYESGAIPDNTPSPYVIISDVSSSEDSNKCRYGNTVQTLIDVVGIYPRNQLAGSKEVDSIAGQILLTINSRAELPLINGLYVMSTRVSQDQKLTNTTTTNVIYRRLIRFEQQVFEK